MKYAASLELLYCIMVQVMHKHHVLLDTTTLMMLFNIIHREPGLVHIAYGTLLPAEFKY